MGFGRRYTCGGFARHHRIPECATDPMQSLHVASNTWQACYAPIMVAIIAGFSAWWDAAGAPAAGCMACCVQSCNIPWQYCMATSIATHNVATAYSATRRCNIPVSVGKQTSAAAPPPSVLTLRIALAGTPRRCSVRICLRPKCRQLPYPFAWACFVCVFACLCTAEACVRRTYANATSPARPCTAAASTDVQRELRPFLQAEKGPAGILFRACLDLRRYTTRASRTRVDAHEHPHACIRAQAHARMHTRARRCTRAYPCTGWRATGLRPSSRTSTRSTPSRRCRNSWQRTYRRIPKFRGLCGLPLAIACNGGRIRPRASRAYAAATGAAVPCQRDVCAACAVPRRALPPVPLSFALPHRPATGWCGACRTVAPKRRPTRRRRGEPVARPTVWSAWAFVCVCAVRRGCTGRECRRSSTGAHTRHAHCAHTHAPNTRSRACESACMLSCTHTHSRTHTHACTHEHRYANTRAHKFTWTRAMYACTARAHTQAYARARFRAHI